MKIRASQISGCGFCTDMHTKGAAQAGDASVRLNLIATWREATVFTDAERAALELAEQAPASPMRPAASPTRPGRMPPSTKTAGPLDDAEFAAAQAKPEPGTGARTPSPPPAAPGRTALWRLEPTAAATGRE